MTVKNIIQESLNSNPMGLKEAFISAIQGRIAEALQNKVAEFSMNEAREESPVARTKKVASFEGKEGHRAEVRKHEDGEFQVHHYNNGKHMGEGPVSYHGEGKEDAMDTAKHAVNNMHIAGGKLKMNEEVELDEGNADNKLKKNVYTAKLGHAADVTRSNFSSPELKPFTSRNSSTSSRDALKNVLAKTLRAGRAELKHGKNAGFVQTLNDFGKDVRKEEVEIDEDSKETKNKFIAALGAAKLGTKAPTTPTSKTPRLNTKAIRAGRALLKSGMEEEVEQIDEISRRLATAYEKKAKRTLRPLQNTLDMGLPNKEAMKMSNKRTTGIVQALAKKSGSAKVNATEDLDEGEVKKPTGLERIMAADGTKDSSAKMGVNKLAYHLDKPSAKPVSLPKAPWDKK